MISKNCDWCKKEIPFKDDKYPWSEWCVFHFKKRRDFCSNECLNLFVTSYVEEKKPIKYSFEQFETRCNAIAHDIMQNKDIKNIFGIPRGGLVPAVRISYLTGLPLTGDPNIFDTAIIDDCKDTGKTLAGFEAWKWRYVLVDKQKEKITQRIIFFWEEECQTRW